MDSPRPAPPPEPSPPEATPRTFVRRAALGLISAIGLGAAFLGGRISARRGDPPVAPATPFVPPADGAAPATLGDAFRERARELAAREVTLEHDGHATVLTARELGVELDVDAFYASAGKDVVPYVERNGLDAIAERLTRELAIEPAFEGDLVIEAGAVSPRFPAAGQVVDLEALPDALTRALAAPGVARATVPTKPDAPELERASVEDAARLATDVLKGPVRLDFPAAERALLKKEKDADETRFELDVEKLAGALATRIVPGEAGKKLEVFVDAAALKADLRKLERRFAQPARDATFEIKAEGGLRIVPSKRGTKVEPHRVAEALLVAAQTPARRGVLPIDEAAEPSLSTQDAEALGIRGLIGQFSTKFKPKQARVTNIKRAAEVVDGAIVKPGEVLSLNAILGPRTLARGFVLAPSIGDGDIVDSIGGGVSQFATTLYNAGYNAGLAVLDHKPHSYYFTRYPAGIEATVSWPKPDLKFRNDTKAGVLIKTAITDGSVTVYFFGDVDGRRTERKVGEKYAFVEPKVEYQPDPALEADEERVVDGGSAGFSIDVGRTITQKDGTKREEKRTVRYRARTRVVKVHPCKIPKGEPGYSGEACP